MHRYTSREPSLHHSSQRSSNITPVFAATVPSFQAQHVATPHSVSVHFSDTSHHIILMVPASCWGRCRWWRFDGVVQRCVPPKQHSRTCFIAQYRAMLKFLEEWKQWMEQATTLTPGSFRCRLAQSAPQTLLAVTCQVPSRSAYAAQRSCFRRSCKNWAISCSLGRRTW